MGAQTVDYRVSKVVVCCKDCGQDVGLYPARHKCQDVIRPPLPPLPTMLSAADDDQRSRSNPNSSPMTSGQTENAIGGKWSRFVKSQKDTPKEDEENDSFYFNNFAAHLPETESQSTPSGKKLWGKVRQNEKWKQLSEKHDKSKQSAKLWDKLVQATQNMAEKIPSRDDRGPESDESDFEGETHVSRVLREYYEKKNKPLPPWMYDARTPRKLTTRVPEHAGNRGNDAEAWKTTSRKQRLWETENNQLTQREREREELRRQELEPHRGGSRYSQTAPMERQRSRYNDKDSPARYEERSDYRGRYDEDHYARHDDNRRMRHEEPSRHRYDDPPRPRYEEPSRPRYEEPPRPRYEEPPRTRFEEPPRTRYEEPPRPRYEEPSRPRYEEPTRHRYEEPSRPRYDEPPRPRYNESQRQRHDDDYDRRRPMATQYDHDHLARYNSPPRDRLRGPRELPTRQTERAGGYF